MDNSPCAFTKLDNAYRHDTGGLKGIILCIRHGVHSGEVILREQALVVSSAAASDSNASLWSELEHLDRARALGGGTAVIGAHAAACCALRDLHATGVREKLLFQCSAEGGNPRSEASVYKHFVSKGFLPFEGFTVAEYSRLLGVIKSNAFHFEPCELECRRDDVETNPQDGCCPCAPEMNERGLGKALFEWAPQAANHSCAPNAKFAFSWDERTSAWTISFIALNQISAGEEVNISYLDAEELSILSRSQRRQKLRTTWGFDCDCRRCTLERETDPDEEVERVPTPPLTGLEW